MRRGRAPALAAWLLEHCGCSSNNDALLGDLAERKGKTTVWYWNQVVVSIFVSVSENVRTNPMAALRALIAGWLVYWTLGYVFFHFGFYQLMLDSLRLDNPDLLIGKWAPPVWWHTSNFGRIYTFGANAIATAAMGLIGVVSGWVVATLFRPNHRAPVFLFSATVQISWIYYGVTLGSHAIGAGLPWSVYFWMNSALQSLGILIGALIAGSMTVGSLLAESKKNETAHPTLA